MKTLEQIQKIENVILYVLQKFDDGVDYIKLFKIIYFAQRDYLCRFGKTLIPETFKARMHGPIPTLTDKVIKNVEDGVDDDFPDLKEFMESIKVIDQKVYALREPNLDFIAKKERECLDKWFDYCKDRKSYDLSEESHDDVYHNVVARSKKDPQQDIMTNIDIAMSGHASDKMIEYIREKELLVYFFSSSRTLSAVNSGFLNSNTSSSTCVQGFCELGAFVESLKLFLSVLARVNASASLPNFVTCS